jgi:glycosyltransferase involved in cell wall biosynthesis
VNVGTKPSVSVVIPLYNKASYILRALDTVARQTCPPSEVIVVDDGSTDEGPRLVAEAHPQVQLIHQANAGQSSARNAGIEAARGDYIAFLDADDEWAPVYLEAIVALAERFPQAAVLATGYVVRQGSGLFRLVTIEEGDPTLVADYFRRALQANFVWVSAAVAPRARIVEAGGFRVGQHRGGDRDMWARLALTGPVAYEPRPLATYRADAAGRENPKRGRALQRPPFGLYVDAAVSPMPPDVIAYANHLWWQYAWSCVAAEDRAELRYVADRLSKVASATSRARLLRVALLMPWPVVQLWRKARTSAVGRPRNMNLARNGVRATLLRQPPS